jgi:hypothetical protein
MSNSFSTDPSDPPFFEIDESGPFFEKRRATTPESERRSFPARGGRRDFWRFSGEERSLNLRFF